MRPLHDAVMRAAHDLADFEVGLNMKGVDGTDRLVAQPAGGMCQYKVVLADAGEVDGALAGWLREAYAQAG